MDTWREVDNYLTETLVKPDDLLFTVRQRSDEAGLPPKQHVTPALGKLLHMLVQIQGARSILEIGTLAGYSTIWLARALPPGGKLVSLELDPQRAELARDHISLAGLEDKVDIQEGDAITSLESFTAEGREPFDFIFIDADIPRNAEYLECALRCSRVGSIIVCDNVIRDGGILDADSDDPKARGAREFCELVGSDPRLEATAIQTVSSKQYDGFAVARVVSR